LNKTIGSKYKDLLIELAGVGNRRSFLFVCSKNWKTEVIDTPLSSLLPRKRRVKITKPDVNIGLVSVVAVSCVVYAMN